MNTQVAKLTSFQTGHSIKHDSPNKLQRHGFHSHVALNRIDESLVVEICRITGKMDDEHDKTRTVTMDNNAQVARDTEKYHPEN